MGAQVVQSQLPALDRQRHLRRIEDYFNALQRPRQSPASPLEIRFLQHPNLEKSPQALGRSKRRQLALLRRGEEMPGDLVNVDTPGNPFGINADITRPAHQANDQSLGMSDIEAQPRIPARRNN